MKVPEHGDSWVGLTNDALHRGASADWAVRPECGALVVCSGTARDHSEGRPGVSRLEYEADEEQVDKRLSAIVDEIRQRWPDVARVALLHRVGEVPIGQFSVLVVVSAPHRDEAFAAARFGIDTLKATVPIWKRETWEGGESYARESHQISELGSWTA